MKNLMLKVCLGFILVILTSCVNKKNESTNIVAKKNEVEDSQEVAEENLFPTNEVLPYIIFEGDWFYLTQRGVSEEQKEYLKTLKYIGKTQPATKQNKEYEVNFSSEPINIYKNENFCETHVVYLQDMNSEGLYVFQKRGYRDDLSSTRDLRDNVLGLIKIDDQLFDYNGGVVHVGEVLEDKYLQGLELYGTISTRLTDFEVPQRNLECNFLSKGSLVYVKKNNEGKICEVYVYVILTKKWHVF